MTNARHCRGTNAKGVPCGSPVVGKDGWCPAHDPMNPNEMKHRGLKGALAARNKGFDVSSLPAIEGPKDAAAWAEAVAKAVATGRLSNGAGNTVLRAVRDWLAAYETSELVERFEALETMIEGVVKQQHRLQPNRAVGRGK